jgi:hypothetical protein
MRILSLPPAYIRGDVPSSVVRPVAAVVFKNSLRLNLSALLADFVFIVVSF